MKILLFSDLHTSVDAAKRLVIAARLVDFVIGAGDFANGRQNIGACINVLKSITVPSVLVAGNNETTAELIDACRKWPSAIVLHGRSTVVKGVPIFGIGGGVPVTPFGAWSYDFTEDDAATLLSTCPPRSVLVSHSPPRGAVDVSSSGQSLGSTAVRDAIVRTDPLLVVCGHIHASAGQQVFVGMTPVVNAGPRGIVWDLN
jgi:Icc-related predicted phosphoesterase